MASAPRDTKPSITPRTPDEIIEEDPSDALVFSIYKNLQAQVIDFFVEHWAGISLRYPPRKDEKFRSFCSEFLIAVPDDIVSTAPFVDGRGPQGGTNEMWTLTGCIKFRMPEDEKKLEVFDVLDSDLNTKYRDSIKVSESGKSGRIRDTKMILTLLALRPDVFRITSYQTLARRRPRKEAA
jgi:hypothetical protein